MGGGLARTAGHVLSLRSRRTCRDPVGVPVRARPDPYAGAQHTVALWRGQGRVHLGPGPRQSGHRAAGSRNHLRRTHTSPDPGCVVVAVLAAQEWNAAKGEVAPWWGECSKEAFNTGLDNLARAPEELGRLPIREAQGRCGGVSP